MGRLKILLVLLLILGSIGAAYLYHYHYIHQYDALIQRVATVYGLDPVLVRALIYEESYFDRNARSRAGAVGLMQVTSIIVREWSRVTGKQQLAYAFATTTSERSREEALRMTEEQLLTDPEVNLHLGCWYLSHLMQRNAELDDPLPVVLASYNAGPSHAARWQRAASEDRALTTNSFIEEIDFPETKNYVRNILTRYKKFKQNKGDDNMLGWLWRNIAATKREVGLAF